MWLSLFANCLNFCKVVENAVEDGGVNEHLLEEPCYDQSNFQFLSEKTKPVQDVKGWEAFLVLNKISKKSFFF